MALLLVTLEGGPTRQILCIFCRGLSRKTCLQLKIFHFIAVKEERTTSFCRVIILSFCSFNFVHKLKKRKRHEHLQIGQELVGPQSQTTGDSSQLQIGCEEQSDNKSDNKQLSERKIKAETKNRARIGPKSNPSRILQTQQATDNVFLQSIHLDQPDSQGHGVHDTWNSQILIALGSMAGSRYWYLYISLRSAFLFFISSVAATRSALNLKLSQIKLDPTATTQDNI